jgi:sialate O-acetylesterase
MKDGFAVIDRISGASSLLAKTMRKSMRDCRWALLLCLCVCLAGAAGANVSLPHIFGDNMVLQQNMPVPVWGWAEKGETVKVSFAGQEKTVTADADGNWMVKLDPLTANKIGRDLTVTGANTLTFTNVLVGEVWVCSGQSNMEFSFDWGLTNLVDEKAATANYPMIRHIKIAYVHNAFPQNDVDAHWDVVSPTTAGGCTAVGYFFARELVKNLDVPVGIVDSNWGGTRIEAWINREGFAGVPQLSDMSQQVENALPDNAAGHKRYLDYLAAMKVWQAQAQTAIQANKYPPSLPQSPWLDGDNQQLTHLFNGKINPLVPFAIHGALWYQGENNGGEGISYFYKMQALINGWRQVWKEGDFPFYFVQLANFQTSDPNKPAMGDGWANLRDAQLQSLSIPHTGMAVTIDIGNASDIHPKDKQDVGKRLAAWALAKDFGKKIEYSGPLYNGMKVEGNKIRIAFDHANSGLMVGAKTGLDPVQEVAGGKVKWISIAGADKQFYWADAVIDGTTLVVSSDKVPNPVAVRYAFTMNPDGANLYNKDGFPASPFRTDNW